jgi:hypothetical protein
MRLTIQIDKEVNVPLLLEQLSPLSSNVNVNLPNRELIVITDQPMAVLTAYQDHDSTQMSRTDEALQARRQEAARLQAALEGLNFDTATAAQMAPALRALLRYMQVRMTSEGD